MAIRILVCLLYIIIWYIDDSQKRRALQTPKGFSVWLAIIANFEIQRFYTQEFWYYGFYPKKPFSRKSCFLIISRRTGFHKHWAVNYTLWSRGDFPDGQMALWAGFHTTTSLWRLLGTTCLTNRLRLIAKYRVTFKKILAKGQVQIILAQLSNFETSPFCFACYEKFVHSKVFLSLIFCEGRKTGTAIFLGKLFKWTLNLLVCSTRTV